MLRRSLPTAILAAFAALLIGGLIMALPNPASDAGPTLGLRLDGSGVSGVSGSNAAIATRPGTAQPDIAPAPAAPIPGAVTTDTPSMSFLTTVRVKGIAAPPNNSASSNTNFD